MSVPVVLELKSTLLELRLAAMSLAVMAMLTKSAYPPCEVNVIVLVVVPPGVTETGESAVIAKSSRLAKVPP